MRLYHKPLYYFTSVLMGKKEGVKTVILVVYIPARTAKVIVTCINDILKNIPHSSLTEQYSL